MEQVYEADTIRMILEVTDTTARVEDLELGFHAVVVEAISENEDVEGTILYFPGVRAKELLK